MDAIYARGDRIAGRFLLLHTLIAVGLAAFYETWLVSGVVTVCALAMFFISARLLPRSLVTRCLAGVSLQTFVALHIYQLHGMAEMHFFFFTGTTVLIVYQDWRCFWPGALGIIGQHIVFALLHNTGVNVYFFDQDYVGATQLTFHFGIVLGQVGICGYWAHLLRRQTVDNVRRNQRLQRTNARVRAEIAERHRIEAELREAQGHYQRISDNVPGVVYQFVRQPDGSVGFLFMSGGCQEVFEVEPLEAVRDHQTVFARIHPEDLSGLRQSIDDSAESLLPWRWEGRLLLGDERTKWIQGASRPAKLSDGTIIWDGVVVDVSVLKRAEAELRATKDEAERANLAKSEFLSRMSHELRTPLNAILGFGQLLEARPMEESEAESVRYILKGGRHLLGLINEVLDISRIEAGKMAFSVEVIPICYVLEEVTDLVKPLAHARDIRLQAPDWRGEENAFSALADMQRLKQVVLNVLSNAIKYNRDAGEVIVTCEKLDVPLTPRNGRESKGEECGTIRISVRDTGPGIALESLPRLFTPFDRLGAERTHVEGSGVGLALSKRIMEAMGGRIEVESVPGQGCTFHLDLPAVQPPAGMFSSQVTPTMGRLLEEPKSARKRQIVLYVEDNLANRLLMERVLDQYGHLQLLTAIQGGIALELARKHRPALILLDLHLPDISGTEVLARLRAAPETRDIPVVVVSADVTGNQVQRLLAMGAHRFLSKPFNVGELLSVVDTLTSE